MKLYVHAAKSLYKYSWKNQNGKEDYITSYLPWNDVQARLKRLDSMISLLEGFDSGEYAKLYKRFYKAYNTKDNFTGIVRLSSSEKELLGYLWESELLSKSDQEALEFYTGTNPYKDKDTAYYDVDGYDGYWSKHN